jgi:hypothetical protein
MARFVPGAIVGVAVEVAVGVTRVVAVGVAVAVAVARVVAVAVAVERVVAVAVGVEPPPVTTRLSTLGPLGSSVARMRTLPAGRLTLWFRTVQFVHVLVDGKDRLETTVVPFTWIDIGRSVVPPFP